MTFTEIVKQVSALSSQERKQLVLMLVDSLDFDGVTRKTAPKTGAEIAAMLETMEPIEFVDAEIEDPVIWLKTQREKERQHRLGDWGADE